MPGATERQLRPTGLLSGERRETHVYEGDLMAFLSDTFLPGYLEGKPSYWSEIPQILADILPALEMPDICTDYIAISSIPKLIARSQLGLPMPPKFWEIGRLCDQAVTVYEKKGMTVEAAFLRSFTGDPDLDLKAKITNGYGIHDLTEQFYYQLMKRFPKRVTNVIEFTKVDPKTQAELHGEEFYVHYNRRFIIRVSVGPVATIPHLNMMQISILDRQSASKAWSREQDLEYFRDLKSVFHVDVLRLQDSQFEAEADNRAGRTSRIQDNCVAGIRFADNRVLYAMTQDAVDALNRQNELYIRPNKEVPEYPFRAARESLIYAPDSLLTTSTLLQPEGRKIDKLNLEVTTPWLEGRSLFEIRRWVLSLVNEGKGLNPKSINLIRKEVYLLLAYDFHGAIEFLRHSFLSMLIPGLAHLTDNDWERVLQHSLMTVQPLDSTSAFSPDIRSSVGFMNDQRQLYKTGILGDIAISVDDGRLHGGVRRFITALGELGLVRNTGNVVEAYLRLWDPEQSRVKSAVSSEDVDYGFVDLKQLIESVAPLIVSHADQYSYKGRLLEVSSAYSAVVGRDKDSGKKLITTEWFANLCLSYDFLLQSPLGLTAKDWHALYTNRQITDSGLKLNKRRFEEMLLDLKLMGLIEMCDMQIYIDGHGKKTQVYSPRETSFSLTRIDSAVQFRGHNAVQEEAATADALKRLDKLGIVFLESLSDLTEVDIKLLHERSERKNNRPMYRGGIRALQEDIDVVKTIIG